MAAALDVSERTVFRAKRRYVEEGLEEVLRHHNSPNPYRKVDDRVEAHLIALACSPAPEGQDHWTMPALPTLDIWGPHIDNSGSTSVEFPDVDLRPGGSVKLDPIHLVCDSKLAGTTLTAKWTATSSSASGVARGEFPIKISSEIFSLLIE